MGGHGVYIWAAYGLTLVILAANLWWPMLARRNSHSDAEKCDVEGYE